MRERRGLRGVCRSGARSNISARIARIEDQNLNHRGTQSNLTKSLSSQLDRGSPFSYGEEWLAGFGGRDCGPRSVCLRGSDFTLTFFHFLVRSKVRIGELRGWLPLLTTTGLRLRYTAVINSRRLLHTQFFEQMSFAKSFRAREG